MYKIIRSKRRTMSIEVNSKLEVVVRAPLFVGDSEISRFVDSHRNWIDEHIEKRRARLANRPIEPSEDEIKVLKKKAQAYLPTRVEYYAEIMGVKPVSVKITSAEKRLGSCSSVGNICFSFRVMLYDIDVIDYVVIHELAHLKEHNHSKRFYSIVEKYCPDYREIERRIKW